jgi:hypothetical protein
MFAYKIAGLAEIVLVLVEHSGYFHAFQLPLGGGQVQQIGIVFAAAHVVSESSDLLKSFASQMTTVVRRRRRLGKRPNKERAKVQISR